MPVVDFQGTLAASTSANPGLSPEASTPVLIYENSIAFLKEACCRINRDSSILLQFSLPAGGIVGAIVESVKCRRVLLELSSDLGLTNNPNLRNALHLDERRIAGCLETIFCSQSAEPLVLGLRSESAQSFLDVVQDTLNRGLLMAPEQSRQARRIIRKLSEASESLPSSLFVTGVSGRDPHPLFAGGYGDIYRAEYRTGTVALKHMRHFMQTSDLRDIRLKLCREALVWKDLRHPNILKFIGIDRDSFPDSLCLVSPWMEHGTVLNYLKDHGRANVDKVLFEVAQGLEYLHSHDVVHGDLRGANILIKDDWCACLADFGLSVLVFATTSGSSTQAGSVYWMAPELIDPPRFGCRYARTPASDVYAFGCVCFELHTGHPPLSDLSEAATLLKVVNGERADRPAKAFMLSDVLWDHIASYWAQIPAERPPSDTVVRQMTWPHARNSSRPLPAIPCSPTTTASGPLVSSPLHYRSDSFETLPPYNSARGSRNYTGQYHFNRDEELQVEETAVTAEVESQDHDLGRMIELLGKAAERTMGNQSVILEGGMETRLEQARKRATEKHEAFVDQLAGYSNSGRLDAQDAVLRLKNSKEPAHGPKQSLTWLGKHASHLIHSAIPTHQPSLSAIRPKYLWNHISQPPSPRALRRKSPPNHKSQKERTILGGGRDENKRGQGRRPHQGPWAAPNWAGYMNQPSQSTDNGLELHNPVPLGVPPFPFPTLSESPAVVPSNSRSETLETDLYRLSVMPEEARVHRISPPATPQSPRSHSPELLRPQFHTHIPSVDVQPEESIRKATVRARALYDFIAAPDDPDEISFCKGDVLDIIDEQGKWWLVQDAVGSLGIAPSDHFSLNCGPDSNGPDDSQITLTQEELVALADEQLEWWRARADSISSTSTECVCWARALYAYDSCAEDPDELSFEKGETLEILDKEHKWWQARRKNGETGIVPSNYLEII